jgi:uncharacterized protein
MVTSALDIKTPWWQAALGEVGGIITDADDISQCIEVICSTQKGEVPHRPEFGVDYLKYIGQPVNEVIPLLVRDVILAILEFEPRVDVDDVDIEPGSLDLSHLIITIEWSLKESEFSSTTRVEVGGDV